MPTQVQLQPMYRYIVPGVLFAALPCHALVCKHLEVLVSVTGLQMLRATAFPAAQYAQRDANYAHLADTKALI